MDPHPSRDQQSFLKNSKQACFLFDPSRFEDHKVCSLIRPDIGMPVRKNKGGPEVTSLNFWSIVNSVLDFSRLIMIIHVLKFLPSYTSDRNPIVQKNKGILF